MKTLIVDNYDSFTYNLYQLIAEVNGVEPLVIKNDTLSWNEFLELDYDNIVISPGPGNPANENDFGICHKILTSIDVPILGVCLGHQGLCHAYGGEITQAARPMHGRVSLIQHENDPLFAHIPNSFKAVRYHSLVVDQATLPPCIEVIARTEDGAIMAAKHRYRSYWGVQFHPESILSTHGKQLLKNFNAISQQQCQHKRIKTPTNTPAYHLHSVQLPFDAFDSPKVFDAVYREAKHAVWLDSSRIDSGVSRYSIMGACTGPRSYHASYDVSAKLIQLDKQGELSHLSMTIFDFIEYELAAYPLQVPVTDIPFLGGFIGYFGYELKADTHEIQNHKQSRYADAQFLFLDQFIIIDHTENKLHIVCLDHEVLSEEHQRWLKRIQANIFAIDTNKPSRVATLSEATAQSIASLVADSEQHFLQNQAQYLDSIMRIQAKIRQGESYEVCLTNKIKQRMPGLDFLAYYQQLRKINPAPYSAYLHFDSLNVACSSMERFLNINTNGEVETKPIKGTLPRGDTPAQDQQLREALQSEEKFQSENLMIVDLLRNDLGKVCQIGSVHVPKLMDVESYANVHQLVTTVRGLLKNDVSTMDCLKGSFPGGSITGAPKKRTMDIIDTLETEARGVYTGSIGYISLNHTLDLNIVIRTAVQVADEVEIGVGGAIIEMSDPQEEYDEIRLKSKTLLQGFAALLKSQVLPTEREERCEVS